MRLIYISAPQLDTPPSFLRRHCPSARPELHFPASRASINFTILVGIYVSVSCRLWQLAGGDLKYYHYYVCTSFVDTKITITTYQAVEQFIASGVVGLFRGK